MCLGIIGRTCRINIREIKPTDTLIDKAVEQGASICIKQTGPYALAQQSGEQGMLFLGHETMDTFHTPDIKFKP